MYDKFTFITIKRDTCSLGSNKYQGGKAGIYLLDILICMVCVVVKLLDLGDVTHRKEYLRRLLNQIAYLLPHLDHSDIRIYLKENAELVHSVP
mmetsp:Transcript_19490/g.27418  ORF Transcript_19490/g.27418 Transcript_19490/m.27418 type:complete len:93 (-) Transcript_19490:50-328(-)